MNILKKIIVVSTFFMSSAFAQQGVCGCGVGIHSGGSGIGPGVNPSSPAAGSQVAQYVPVFDGTAVAVGEAVTSQMNGDRAIASGDSKCPYGTCKCGSEVRKITKQKFKRNVKWIKVSDYKSLEEQGKAPELAHDIGQIREIASSGDEVKDDVSFQYGNLIKLSSGTKSEVRLQAIELFESLERLEVAQSKVQNLVLTSIGMLKDKKMYKRSKSLYEGLIKSLSNEQLERAPAALHSYKKFFTEYK